MKTAVITGISGQDGYYLARYLIENDINVLGITTTKKLELDLPFPREKLALRHTEDYSEPFIKDVLHSNQVDFIFNLAAQSSSQLLYDTSSRAIGINALQPLNWLNAILSMPKAKRPKFFQAASSEIFSPLPGRLDENSPICPTNAYAVCKSFAYSMVKLFRAHHGIFAQTGILFNHESPKRPTCYVTRKITSSVAKVLVGEQDHLHLKNLDTERDWSDARDFVRAMWLSLQLDQPVDLIFSSGKLHSIRDICNIAFGHVGLDYRDYVVCESEGRDNHLAKCGDSSKLRKATGWEPSISFNDMIIEMLENDINLLKQGPKL